MFGRLKPGSISVGVARRVALVVCRLEWTQQIVIVAGLFVVSIVPDLIIELWAIPRVHGILSLSVWNI